LVPSDSHVREELRVASDEVIEDAVTYADPLVLRGLVYQLTGDEEVARVHLNAVGPRGTMAGGDDDTALLRRKAVEFLKAYRDSGAGEISIGPEERLPTSLRLASTFELADEDMGLYVEELSLDPWARGLHWQAPPPQERLEAFNVTNTTVFGAPNGTFGSAAFGTITTALDPRVLQAAVKFAF
jgi:4-hydroxyacetophenone monooxygenase